MNGRKQRWKGCLLALLLIVGIPTLIVWRELRQERLSSELMATIKRVKTLSKESYYRGDADEMKKLEKAKLQVRNEEVKVPRLLDQGADPNVRDFMPVKRTFWEHIKILVKRALGRKSSGPTSSQSALAIAVYA